VAFLVTGLEALATLLMLRLVWRLLAKAAARLRGRGRPGVPVAV
jgi:cytochrome b